MTHSHTAALPVALAASLVPPGIAQTSIGALPSGSGVEIAGAVTHVLGDRFVVDDGAGSVLVETGPSWRHDIAMAVGEQVRVRGEPDGGAPDAFVSFCADGETLRIRPENGRPPWAGSRRD